jgi:AraC-like DNA-binding protein
MPLEALIARVLARADALGVGDEPMECGVPGLAIARNRTPGLMRHSLYKPVFCLVLQGEKQMLHGTQTLRFAQMQSLIVSVEMPALSQVVQASVRQPYLALALALDAEILRELLPQLPDSLPPEAAHGDSLARLARTAPADSAVLASMARLFDLTLQPEAQPVLVPLIAREIHYWLLTGPHGPALRDLVSAEGHAARIARAIAAMRRDLAQRLRISDLAREAGMSESSFHEHFRQVTARTPLQFYKQLKLLEARRLMFSGREGVSGAAFAVGYESPTQFSREYARTFGASPRQDMLRSRAAG